MPRMRPLVPAKEVESVNMVVWSPPSHSKIHVAGIRMKSATRSQARAIGTEWKVQMANQNA